MERATNLDFSKSFTKQRESDFFRPNEKNADPVARICLDCQLPEDACNKQFCKRFEEERKGLRRNET